METLLTISQTRTPRVFRVATGDSIFLADEMGDQNFDSDLGRIVMGVVREKLKGVGDAG